MVIPEYLTILCELKNEPVMLKIYFLLYNSTLKRKEFILVFLHIYSKAVKVCEESGNE